MTDSENKTHLEEMQEAYAPYKEKFDLPELERIHKILEISSIEDDGLVLITLRKKVMEKISKIIEILDSIIQPDASTKSMYEANFYKEDDMKVCFDLYKQLMIMSTRNNIIALDEKDEENASFVKEFISSYDDIKETVRKLLEIQDKAWKENSENSEVQLGYFG